MIRDNISNSELFLLNSEFLGLFIFLHLRPDVAACVCDKNNGVAALQIVLHKPQSTSVTRLI